MPPSTFYRVEATYKPEHQTNGVIGCGMVCDTEEQAKIEETKYKANPRIASVKITHKRYGY